ncbi:MAG: hydrogenase accessory protein HypB, partial [Leptospirillum sp. Group IV 'UBA BS']
AVIEGDQETSRDADRIRQMGVQAVQINTGPGCHLDAHQVAHAAGDLDLSPGMLLVIENIGNLVCPALFDLGETARVVLFSVTEGEDKPLKYPRIFRDADLTLLTKSDLLPHLEFDRARAENSLRSVNPRGEILTLSARTGEGMDRWLSWLASRKESAKGIPDTPLFGAGP